jgi:tight adherence protein B
MPAPPAALPGALAAAVPAAAAGPGLPAGSGLLLAILAGAAAGAAVMLVIAGIRGVPTSLSLPPPWWQRRTPSVPARRADAGRLLVAATAAVFVLWATAWPVAAAASAALILGWPHLLGGADAEQQATARLEALVTWTDSLRDTVAAGISLEQAIPATTARAPALIRPALLRLTGQMRAQTPMDAALVRLADDLDDPSADLVIAALVLNARRRGDRLPQVLAGLAVTARAELDLRRRISAGRAGLRRGVQIIIAVTVLVAAYLTVFAHTYLAPYGTGSGQLALALVVALLAGGLLWLRRLAVEPHTVSFLARPDRLDDPADTRIVAAITALSAPTTLSARTSRIGPSAPAPQANTGQSRRPRTYRPHRSGDQPPSGER